MPRLVSTAPQRAATALPWHRPRPRRVWARRDPLATASVMLAAIPCLSRAGLARLTMRMIDRMDDIDGDPDLEHVRDDDEDGNDREQAND